MGRCRLSTRPVGRPRIRGRRGDGVTHSFPQMPEVDAPCVGCKDEGTCTDWESCEIMRERMGRDICSFANVSAHAESWGTLDDLERFMYGDLMEVDYRLNHPPPDRRAAVYDDTLTGNLFEGMQ